MPKGSVGYYASKVNNLTVEIINGMRTLGKSFDPVNSVSLETALQSFTKFLEKNLHTCVGNQDNLVSVIVGHNAATFDVPTLLRNAGNSFEEQLYNMNICFGDSLPLIRTLLSRQHSPLKQSNGEFCQANLGSVYKCLFNEDFDAHDALEDAIALRKILFSPEMASEVNTIVDCCQMSSIIDVKILQTKITAPSLMEWLSKSQKVGYRTMIFWRYGKSLENPELLEFYPCRHMNYTIVRNVERRIKVAQESRKTSGFFQILLNTLNQIMFQIHPIVVRRKFKYPARFSI